MATRTRKYELNHSTLRTLAALLGTIPVALAVGVALTFVLPLPVGARYLVGVFSVFPLWTAAACLAFLARRGWIAWLALAAVLVLALAVSALALAAGHALPGSRVWP